MSSKDVSVQAEQRLQHKHEHSSWSRSVAQHTRPCMRSVQEERSVWNRFPPDELLSSIYSVNKDLTT